MTDRVFVAHATVDGSKGELLSFIDSAAALGWIEENLPEGHISIVSALESDLVNFRGSELLAVYNALAVKAGKETISRFSTSSAGRRRVWEIIQVLGDKAPQMEFTTTKEEAPEPDQKATSPSNGSAAPGSAKKVGRKKKEQADGTVAKKRLLIHDNSMLYKGKLPALAKIKRLVRDNPRRPGTHGDRSWAIGRSGMTIEQYVDAGGRRNDLRWCIAHGWIGLTDFPSDATKAQKEWEAFARTNVVAADPEE